MTRTPRSPLHQLLSASLLIFASTIPVPASGQGAEPTFRGHTIATDLKGGYHLVAIDVNHDGKPDLIALASGMPDLVWFENPGWERHVIVSGRNEMINCAAADVDGDGIPEILLADGFSMDPSQSPGIVTLLRHQGDPRQPWSAREIDRLATSHRLRVAHLDGKPVFVNAPLAGSQAKAPDYRDFIPLVFYRPGDWEREPISRDLQGVLHGIYIVDWDGDGQDDVLTASFEGIHLFRKTAQGWEKMAIAKGDPSPWPKSGSSDVAVGKLGKARFLAAIEPWHGNQVAVYRKSGNEWQRRVIDQGLEDGHTILTADFDRDGRDEILAGFRKGKNLMLYHAQDPDGEKWSATTLDPQISAAGCVAADFNGDGKIDLACLGTPTATLKWYENTTPAKTKP